METVLRIYNILVLIRIRLFSSLTFKMPTKNKFFKKFFFLFIPFWRFIFQKFSKIKSHKEVIKQLESRFFILFLLDDRRIRIQEAKKHTDPMDPDPQHRMENKLFVFKTGALPVVVVCAGAGLCPLRARVVEPVVALGQGGAPPVHLTLTHHTLARLHLICK